MEKENSLDNNIKSNDKIVLLVLLFIPCLLVTKGLDNDTWFLLNSGRYVMNNGIPNIEPFSIHENMQFVMQQWMTDVIFWNTYDKLGQDGLFIIITICYSIIIFLMYKLTMKVSGENFFVSYSITMLSNILVYTYMVARPTIFTLVIVMIELNVLENFAIDGNSKVLYILPFLSVIMINLHAALWPILFILIMPYIIDSLRFKIGFLSNEGYNNKYLLLAVAAMFFLAFINPYGIDAMTYLLRSVGYPYMKKIIELQHPYINDVAGALIYAYIAIIISVYIFYKKGTSKIRYILLTVGTIYMVLTSIRNITYFAVCSLFSLSYYLKDYKINAKVKFKNSNKNLRIVLGLVILILLIVFNYINKINRKENPGFVDLNNTIDYILEKEDVSKVTLYTGFNDGSLVQFRGIKSYIDPRAEVYFKRHNKKEDIFNEYFDLIYGKVYYKDVLEKYNFTHLILRKGELLDVYLMEDDNYELIYENDKYDLFRKVKIDM